MMKKKLQVSLKLKVLSSNTLHIGSNQHHEPVYHMPKSGWASSILPIKLRSADSGPGVLQTVGGYWLELTKVPTQSRTPHKVRYSPESKSQITTEVLELLVKRAIVESKTSHPKFSF